MTLDEFEAYMETNDGESHFYEWLYDNDPSLGKHGIIAAMENGDYIESFMDHLGVTDEPVQQTTTTV